MTVRSPETCRRKQTRWSRRVGGLAEDSYLSGEMGLYGNSNEVVNCDANELPVKYS